jgi:hypothetical protein
MWLETTVAAQQPLAAGGLWRHDRPRLDKGDGAPESLT